MAELNFEINLLRMNSIFSEKISSTPEGDLYKVTMAILPREYNPTYKRSPFILKMCLRVLNSL